MLQAYMHPCRARTSLIWEEPIRVPIPYPQYFEPESEDGSQELESLSTLARLHCGEAARDYITAVASKFDEAQQSGSVMFNFTSSGFEVDEFVEMKEQLLTAADDYESA